MGTTASAASQGAVPAGAGGAGGGVVFSWVIRSLLRPVVTPLEVRHLPGGLLRAGRVGVAGANHGWNREPGAQQWPALVLLDLNAHRHALHDLGELPGDH